MDDVNALLAPLRAEVLVEVGLHGRLALALRGHGEQPVRLEHHDDVEVLVQDGQPRRQLPRHRFRDDVDDLAVRDLALRVLLHLPVHAHAAGLQHLAQRGFGGVLKLFLQDLKEVHSERSEESFITPAG